MLPAFEEQKLNNHISIQPQIDINSMISPIQEDHYLTDFNLDETDE